MAAGSPWFHRIRRLIVNTIECTLRGIDAEFQTRQAAARVGGFRAVRRELCDLLVDTDGFPFRGFRAVTVLRGFYVCVPRSGEAVRHQVFVSLTHRERYMQPERAGWMVLMH